MTFSDSLAPQTTPICTFCRAFHVFVIAVVRNFKFGLWINGIAIPSLLTKVIPERGVVRVT